MILSVEERLVILSLLPVEGDYATLKILTDLRLSLSFTEKETKDWGLSVDTATKLTRWEKNEESEIPIGEKATDIIVDALKRRDREKKLPVQAMGVYEKFITTE